MGSLSHLESASIAVAKFALSMIGIRLAISSGQMLTASPETFYWIAGSAGFSTQDVLLVLPDLVLA